MLSVQLSGRPRINNPADFAGEPGAKDARLVGRTVDEHIDYPGTSKLGLESVPLRRNPLQFDELPGLDRIAKLHASVGPNAGLDDQVAHFELRVAGADLNLQGSVKGARPVMPIRRDLQKHGSVDDGIVGTLEGEAAVDFVHGF